MTILPFPINPAPVHGNIFPANTGVYATQAGFNTYGSQASYLLEEEDETQMGLLITFARSEKRGGDGNGVVVTVRDTTSNTVDYDGDARTLDITVTNANQNLSTIKTLIDNLTGTPFTTAYVGSAASDDVETVQGGHFNGGGPDPWGVLFVVPYGNDGRVTIADTVPATAFADYWRARQDEQFTFRIPPGYQVWFLSNDGTVRGGSAAFYTDVPG